MIDSLLEQYRRDGDARRLEAIAHAFRPLVVSVCRRYLRAPDDVNDAAQETFLRFARRASSINGSLAGWFAATAHAASIDLIRATLRQQRVHGQFREARGSDTARQSQSLASSRIGMRLDAALAELDEDRRELLVARFFRQEPLRVIAGNAQVSVATASRRVQQALAELEGVLKGMAASATSDAFMYTAFGRPDAIDDSVPAIDGLRFAPDWSATSPFISPLADEQRFLPGWTRQIRVGVLVSHASILRPDRTGAFLDVEAQALSAQRLDHPGVSLVGICEGQTGALGPIERTMRQYELLGGLIDASDVAGLKTLDVIIIGINWAMAPSVIPAINQAVRSGVGLLNEWWTGSIDGLHRETGGDDGDALRRELMLAGSPIVYFHTSPRCGQLEPASIAEPHPVLGNVTAGTQFNVAGCGPAYEPMLGTRMIAMKDRPVHGSGGASLPMPVWLCGTLGAGRVIVANVGYRHDALPTRLGLDPHRYFIDVLQWLAEPRRVALE